MATLRQYFETDFNHCLSMHKDMEAKLGHETITIQPRVFMDFDANARFLAICLSACTRPAKICLDLLNEVPTFVKMPDDEALISFGWSSGERKQSQRTQRFCGRVFFYSESDLSEHDLDELEAEGLKRDLYITFRGPRYVAERSRHEKPLAFLAHDSRDKDGIARPLAIELTRLMCPVWYNEYSLQVGDSLRESIEKGLRECRKCILILSPNFLANRGWTKVEFNSIFTREILEKQNLVLPVWCGITPEAVFEYSPSLADRVGLQWNKGKEHVANSLRRAIV